MTKTITATNLQSRIQTLQRTWTQLHREVPDVLYHYTDAQGLLGMLKTHRLWATNRRFMNDPTETEYAATVIRTLLHSDETKAYVNKRAAKKKQREVILAKLIEGISQILIWYLDFDEHYLACFCEDGDLLSQWRGYGSVGGGYALGFTARDLGVVIYTNQEKPEPVLRRCLYTQSQQEKWSRDWIRFMADWVTLCCETPPGQKAPNDYSDLGWISFNWFISEALRCFKHPAYEEEREWRVIQFGTAPTGKRAVEPNFRATRRGIVEYVELELPSAKDRLPLQTINYGPTLDSNISNHSLKLLCQGKGYANVAITRSRVPFAG
jgi:hypothetical protein